MSTSKFPKITEEGLADLRKRIGVKITDTIEPWNYEATRDAIRHYAHGIGEFVTGPILPTPGAVLVAAELLATRKDQLAKHAEGLPKMQASDNRMLPSASPASLWWANA